MTYAEKLINPRTAANMSQEELAGKLRVSRQTVSKRENGRTVPRQENEAVEFSRPCRAPAADDEKP